MSTEVDPQALLEKAEACAPQSSLRKIQACRPAILVLARKGWSAQRIQIWLGDQGVRCSSSGVAAIVTTARKQGELS